MRELTRNEAQGIKKWTRIGMSVIAIVTILMFSFANANAGENLSKSEKKLTKQINKMIEYPVDILEGEKDEVVLFFGLNNNGVIDVENVKGMNEELAEYVEKTLEGKSVETFPENTDQKYQIVISFKTI